MGHGARSVGKERLTFLNPTLGVWTCLCRDFHEILVFELARGLNNFAVFKFHSGFEA